MAARAFGYLLAYDEVSCVISGIRTSRQLNANLKVSGRRVTAAERERLEAFWDDFTSEGRNLLPW
jgi:aryl-alcohol dehydrogenase-like predicted oxidoreductase